MCVGPAAFSAGLQWHPVAGEQSEQAQSQGALSGGPEAGQRQEMEEPLHSPQALLGFLSAASKGQRCQQS